MYHNVRTMYLKRKRKEKIQKFLITSLKKKKKKKNTSPNKNISYTNSPLKYMTIFVPKITPLFCHK